jgi:beta-xylosidase
MSGEFSRYRKAALAATTLVIASLLGDAAPLRAPLGKFYRNPILFADYSDPDVIRVGAEYYLIASSFHFVPGIPVLRSADLVHWTIVSHVVSRMTMDPRYDLIAGNRYGGGVWAPAIRRHNGLFYVYFPTPQEGIFVSTAHSIEGPWTPPAAVMAQPGLEDPCPFWDDDGQAYLIHSRVGAGPLILHRMTPDGLHVLDAGTVIVNDPQNLPVLEGPKLYKRNGYYYIFAPFGGVATGAQAVLRSRNLYGSWEHRVVLTEGSTAINGPHQGGYVETPDGQGWFIHFQERQAHGRIVHLEPVRWQDGWPLIGDLIRGTTTGEPVRFGPMPDDARTTSFTRPQTSDDFTGAQLRPQWEWNHNPDNAHWSLTARSGFLRLIPMPAQSLLDARNTLTEMMQDDSFQFTARIDVSGMKPGVHAGLAMFESDASGLQIAQEGPGNRVSYFHLQDRMPGPLLRAGLVQLRVVVHDATARYLVSLDDGHSFQPLGAATDIHASWWKGPRPALFAYTTADTLPGFVDFDWVHYEAIGTNPW